MPFLKVISNKQKAKSKKIKETYHLSLISAGQLETPFQCCSSDISDSAKLKADITYHFRVKQGFTLIELLIVIAIIGILASIIMASYGSIQAKSRDTRRKSDLDAIKKALEAAKQDSTGAYYYPNCDSGSGCLLENTNTNQDLSPSPPAQVYIKPVPKETTMNSPYNSYLYYTYDSGSPCSSNCTTYMLFACLENRNDPQKDTSPGAPAPCNQSNFGSRSARYMITPN